MKPEQIRQDLQVAKDAFDVLVQNPNTVERNVGLATHRTEISRLQKLLDKDQAQRE